MAVDVKYVVERPQDATTTRKGLVKLAGDLGGTADAPRVVNISPDVTVGLAGGGTGSDLSATGPGVLVQATTGANVSVESQLVLSRGGTGSDLSATGPGVLIQSVAGGALSVESVLSPVRGGTGINNGANTLQVPTSGVAALKSGTPTGGNVAFWADANQVGDAGFATSDVARLSQQNVFNASTQTLRGPTGGNMYLVLDSVDLSKEVTLILQSAGTSKWQVGKFSNDNFSVYSYSAGYIAFTIADATGHVLINSSDVAQLAVRSASTTTIPFVVDTPASPAVSLLELRNNGTAKLTVNVEGRLSFLGAMGDSTKNPSTTAPDDWVQVRIGATDYFLPAYLAS